MTTSKNRKTLGNNTARDNSEGVPLDGFQDPTGEYPKRAYHYDTSISKSARGLKVNELYVGGGDIGIPLNIEDQEPSQFPFNQTKETESGHIVEYDDTPAGERILIRHRTGAGVEMRADGSVIISSINNKIEVTGGDQTLIVEGNGNLIYKGNLNLQVTGDYNVDVGGNHNVTVHGNQTTDVVLNQRETIAGDQEITVKQNRSSKVVDHNVDLVLGDNTHIVKGFHHQKVQGEINVFTDNRLITTAADEFIQSSPVMSITGSELSVMGMKGVIGGEKVEFTSPVYMGPKGAVAFTSGASFYGSFHGQATEAIKSYNANVADKAKSAFQALKAGTAGSLGASGTATNPTVSEADQSQESITPVKPVPLADAIGAMMTMGDFSVRTVTIDGSDILRFKILLRDDYEGLFEKIPTTQEIRSTIRDPKNRSAIGAKMVAEGRLGSEWNNPSPPKIGRTSPKTMSSRFGYFPLGNSIANRGKSFKT